MRRSMRLLRSSRLTGSSSETATAITRRWGPRRCARWAGPTRCCRGSDAIASGCCRGRRRAIAFDAKTGAEHSAIGAASATHGVIRVGHAARSRAAAETPHRLRELADAFASWAATYQELPTSHRAPNGAMAPRQAITRVPIVPLDRRNHGGNITASLAMLGDFPEFAPAIGLLDTGGDLVSLVAELTEVFARIYLANARDIRTTIAFIHGVHSPAALGNIAPQVSDRTARAAARYAWQAGCGLYSCFGQDTATAVDIEPSGADADELVERAIAHGDEHVIKFTEVCLHRHALRPSPVYLAAADHVSSMIPRR